MASIITHRSAMLSLLLCCGCYSMSLLQEPKPLPAGKTRIALGTEVGKHALTPIVGLRFGVGGRTEVRLKGAARGVEGGANVQLYDGELLDVMVMPHAFLYDVDSAFDEEPGSNKVVGGALPTVVSISFEQDRAPSQLFVAPDVRAGSRDERGFAAVGAHIGAAVSGPYGYGSFIPECAWLVGVIGSKAEPDDADERRLFARGEHTFSCSFGVSLGHSHPRVFNDGSSGGPAR